MNAQIVKADEKYWESHAETLDQVARERRFIAFLEAPPKHEIRDFVRKLIAQGEIQYFAVHEGKAVGWCDILRKARSTLAHTGVLGIGLRRDYRGSGLGRKLLQAAIAEADAKGLERIELMVRDDNQNAIALYLQCGFKVEARMEKFIKIDGLCYAGLAMARLR